MSMKTMFFLLCCGMAFCHSWKSKPDVTAPFISKPDDTISFAVHIQPILQNKCNPCHFPGGKMYESMPFDQAKTILDHPEGVLKRFKKGEEGRLMRAFLKKE